MSTYVQLLSTVMTSSTVTRFNVAKEINIIRTYNIIKTSTYVSRSNIVSRFNLLCSPKPSVAAAYVSSTAPSFSDYPNPPTHSSALYKVN